MRHRLLFITCTLTALLCAVFASAEGREAMHDIAITVSTKALFQVDDRLFGQMLERASFGEPGPEGAVVAGTHRLQPSVVEKLKEMQIAVLRFPGGTDTDYIDWCDLVDNVPGRGAARPESSVGSGGKTITNRFGYDEYLRLCAEIKTRPLIVVNFRDGLLRHKPLADAARHAAELVAYCNAAVDDRNLPEDLRAWPAARAKNGHARPYGVRLFQIGNETWFFWDALEKLGMTRAQAADWYVTCLEAYVDAMRAADPSIEIIADGSPLHDLLPVIKARLGSKINYIVPEHAYWPFGSYSNMTKDGKPIEADTLTAEEIWKSWVSVPTIDAQTGMSIMQKPLYTAVHDAGYPAANTEWNWNAWGGRGKPLALESSLARGIAVAGLLQALIREGGSIKIAAQSMCVGEGWKGIASIWADPSGATPAYIQSTGQTVMFYTRYHGHDFLPVETRNIPRYAQPYSIAGYPPPAAPIASLDVLATANSKAVFVHIINREFDTDVPVTLDLSAFKAVGRKVIQHCYVGRLNDAPAPGEKAEQIVWFTDQHLTATGKIIHLTLPKRSISSIEIPVTR